jgi:hypothetical protein
MLKSRLIILFFFFHYLAFAEDTVKLKINTLGLETGYGTNQFFDPYSSAKLYYANCLPVNFQWLTEHNKSLEKFKIGVFSSSYSSSGDKVNMTDFNGFQANLNYIYLINILHKKNSIFYLGPGINFTYSYDKYKFYFFEEVYYNTVEILTSIDINPAVRINFQKNWILINASCSLLAYTGYLKYSLGSVYEGSVLAFPRYKSFLFEPSYYHQLSKKIFLSIAYRLFYYSYPKFEKTDYMNRLNNLFTIGVNVKL